MPNQNLYALFQDKFPQQADAVFIETPNNEIIYYHELEQTTALYSALLNKLGINKGDRIVVQADKSPQAVMLYLACLRSGAVYVPLNTAYTVSEVSYFLEDAKPALMVCRPDSLNEVQKAADELSIPHTLTLSNEGLGTLTDALSDITAEPDAKVCQCDRDDLAAILYTSGTTGRSKGAMLTHDNLSSNAVALHRIWGFQPGDVLLHALPIFHVHGLFVALHTAMLNGSPMVFLPKFDLKQVVEAIPKATVMMGVPTFYTRLLDSKLFTRQLCKKMRLFISGSAPLLKDTFDGFEQRIGQRILERYGMTEAGMITSNPLTGERIPETVGYFLPDVEGRVADEHGNQLVPGEIGVLEIKGPNVFKGYWQMPDKTREEFRPDGHFITGDLAKMDDDRRISIVGRGKDLIISGGYNVYPKEIENQIDELHGVRESAVIGADHPDFGEAVVAIIVQDPSAKLNEAQIIDNLTGKLAKFKQPKKIIFVDDLPRNSMGKVQ